MKEIDKYHEMMQSLKDNYSHYDEVDNTNEIAKTLMLTTLNQDSY